MNVFLSGKAKVDAITDSMQKLDCFLKQSITNITSLNESLAQKTAIAARNLQFEDIARQVSEHVDKKIDKISTLLHSVTEDVNSLNEDVDMNNTEFSEKLRMVQNNIEESISEIENETAYKVSVQHSMSERRM